MVRVAEAEFEMSTEEIQNLIDREARARLGISGEDLLARYERGELADPGAVADLLILADLLKEPAAV